MPTASPRKPLVTKVRCASLGGGPQAMSVCIVEGRQQRPGPPTAACGGNGGRQMGPRPGRGRAGGAVPRSRFRRNPKGAWVLLGSAIVRSPKVARPRMRAIAALLLLADPYQDRLRRRALRSPHFHSPIWKFARSGTLRVNTHARDRLYFHHGLLILTGGSLRVLRSSGAESKFCYPETTGARSQCTKSSSTPPTSGCGSPHPIWRAFSPKRRAGSF